MNMAAEWSIRVLSVEPELLHFPDVHQDTIGYRTKLIHPQKIELYRYECIQVTAGTAGTSSWVAFTAIVMEINPESLLLFTAPMYQEPLKEAHTIKRIFSHSIRFKVRSRSSRVLVISRPFTTMKYGMQGGIVKMKALVMTNA